MSEESRKAGTLLRDSEITESIIAATIAVHRELGPGFLESVYEQALAVEFAIRGIAFVRQQAIPLLRRVLREHPNGRWAEAARDRLEALQKQ